MAEENLGVAGIEVHQPAVLPEAVLLQGQGGLEMGDGDQRLHAVGDDIVDKGVVEGQALRVGLRLVPIGEDAGPADGQAVAVPAHARKEFNVLVVMVVVVDGHMAGIVGIRLQGDGLAALDPLTAHCHDVGGAQALAALSVAALDLVGSGGAAPEEIFGKRHNGLLIQSKDHLFSSTPRT